MQERAYTLGMPVFSASGLEQTHIEANTNLTLTLAIEVMVRGLGDALIRIKRYGYSQRPGHWEVLRVRDKVQYELEFGLSARIKSTVGLWIQHLAREAPHGECATVITLTLRHCPRS